MNLNHKTLRRMDKSAIEHFLRDNAFPKDLHALSSFC